MNKVKHIPNEFRAGIENRPVTSDELMQIQDEILRRAKKLSPSEKRGIELSAVKYKMLEYLESDSDNDLIPVGDFIRDYLKAAGIKQKTFAEYIHWDTGNINKLLNGSRSINLDLAIILGSTFNVDPATWLRVQDKNELKTLSKANARKYKQYSLNTLVSMEKYHA